MLEGKKLIIKYQKKSGKEKTKIQEDEFEFII
jgi:hypothetical protein